MQKKLEICCYSVQSAITAEKNGADRIELCDNYSEGGTTPSFAAIKQTLKYVKIPVAVLVRPRGGDFLYSDVEYAVIKEDINKIRELGAAGIVIGFLRQNGEIDFDRTRDIVDLARPLSVTFHRAFDMCNNPFFALNQLAELGITRILTSGAQNTAMEGSNLLADLVAKAGNRITVMPGSGVNEKNLDTLVKKTGAKEFHSSAKIFENSKMSYFNKSVHMGGAEVIDEFKIITVDGSKVKMMAQLLKKELFA